MRILWVFTLLFICNYYHILAQERNIKAGKLINSNGDSLSVWINRTPDYKLATTLEYSEARDSSHFIKISPYQIKGFSIPDERSEFVSIKNGNTQTTDSTNFLFGKQIYEGKINLYLCQNSQYESDYYYILEDAQQFYSLKQLSYQTDPTHIRTVKKFVGILKYVYQECKEANKYVDQLDFNDESIVSQIKKYETCKYGSANGRQIKPKNRILVIPEINVTLGNSFGEEFLDAPLTATLSAFVEIRQPWLHQRISLLTGLGVFTTFINNSESTPVVIPKLQLQVLYKFKLKVAKPYFGAGMCLLPLPLFAFQFGLYVVPNCKLFTQLETQTFGIKSGKMIHLGLAYCFN